MMLLIAQTTLRKKGCGPREHLVFRWLFDSSSRFTASRPTVLSANPIAGPASLWEPRFGQTPSTNTTTKARILWVWPGSSALRQRARRKSSNGLFEFSSQIDGDIELVTKVSQRRKTFYYFPEALLHIPESQDANEQTFMYIASGISISIMLGFILRSIPSTSKPKGKPHGQINLPSHSC